MLLPTITGLILALLPTAVHTHEEIPIENPQITDPPSPSAYTSALTYHSLLLLARTNHRDDTSTSLGSADALSYCQESIDGCSAQLTLFNNCQSQYGTDLKYLYCLCTTGYHSAVSACDACSASLGALAWSLVSSDAGEASTECGSLSETYATDTKTGPKTGTKTHTGTKGGTTAAAEATSMLPSETSTTRSSTFVLTMPTESYAGLAGQPTIPGNDGVAGPTSSGAAVAAAGSKKGVGMVAGVVLCLGGAVLL
ncbi:hypothetical protein PISL3812_08663 [Talaromyces islandicus]|uniref:Uncharacterized protein n=1 Tax=Talaromyces islandicus TaxID=28573 RepID=A0A0U1M7M5_TALIS|nr:hypothetical protein PISL3812_08663 [Talaromyces islandicus]